MSLTETMAARSAKCWGSWPYLKCSVPGITVFAIKLANKSWAFALGISERVMDVDSPEFRPMLCHFLFFVCF